MLRCDDQTALVSSVNPRAEMHGEDRVPACDINLYFETGAKVLDSFAKGLRDALYTDEERKSGQQRIAGTGTADNVGPALRFNATLGPKDGGTCGVSIQLQAHPGKTDAGEIFALVQKEVRLTLQPPTAAEIKKIEKAQREAAEKKKGGEDDEGNE